MHSELILRTLLAGLLIFVCIIIFSYFGAGAGWEIRLAENVLLIFEGLPESTQPSPDNGIRSVMFFFGEPNDSRTTMRQTISVVREFKNRGAKAVFVSVPGMLITDGNKKLLHELDDLGITILWEPLNINAYGPNPLWLGAPLKETQVRWGANTSRVENVPPLFGNRFPGHQLVRISLNSTRDNSSRNSVEDIVVRCMRLVRNYSDSLEILFDGENLILGNDVIPVDSRGSALVRTPYPWLRNDPASIYVSYGLDEEPVLVYDGRNKEDGSYASHDDLAFAGDELKDKIVLLGVRQTSDPLTAEQYPGFLASTIESLLTGQSLRRMGQWTMVIVLLTLIGSVVVCSFFRPLLALVLNGAAVLCLIALHLWCYAHWQLVFEIQYPLLTLAMSAAILSALKLAWENKALRQRLAESSAQ